MGAPDLCVLQVMECTIGGTRRHLTDLARGLAARGVRVHLAVAAERQPDFHETLAELAGEGCVVHEIPMVRSIRPRLDARHLGQLKGLLREVRPDIVHTHSSKAGVLGRLASISTGIGRRVHTPHTMAFLFREMFGPLRRGLFFRIERSLARATDAVVAVSESEARTFAASGVVDPARVRIVPNGVDPVPYAAASRADLTALGLDPERPTAAVIGLLNVAKGQDLALEALVDHPGLQLLLVGHGEMEAELRALAARLGVASRVAFAGFRRDVPGLLAAADLLLLPSRWEGMPYIVLEAMASARPVAATPVDGARDLVTDGETGWLAPTADAAGVSEVLGRALAATATERASLGAAGRARVLERYTVDAMVEGLLALYAELAGGAGSR
jgi:glycosyltransferase involved in cell wall biosynthesis